MPQAEGPSHKEQLRDNPDEKSGDIYFFFYLTKYLCENILNKMSVSVGTLVPHEAVIPMPKSTSKHILRRRQVEILPLESTSFSYSSNDSIKFNISSATELLDGMNSYIKMGFLTGVVGGAVETLCLDVGGAHALFREAELRTQNGTLIQRYDRYNRWYAMMSMATHSPQHVEVVEAAAGDSLGTGYVSSPYKEPEKRLSGNAQFDLAQFTTATDTFTVLDGAATAGGILKLGDFIAIDVAANRYYAHVESITDANAFVVEAIADDASRTLPAANIAAGAIFNISVVNNLYLSQRERVAVARVADYSNGVPLQWKPAMSFLQQRKWIPLAFIKQGLQLELKLERPEYCLNKQQAPAAQTDANIMDYTIYSPRYVAMMVTPDESLMAEYLKQFNGDGIHMSILGYRFARKTIDQSNSGTQVINNHFGVRSARHVMSVIQSSRISEDVSRSSRGNFSLSNFFRSFLTSYQYKSGSEEFPMRAVDCDAFSTEAFQQLMLSTDQHGGTLWNVRFDPKEWANLNNVISATTASPQDNIVLPNRSTKFIMATRLDRGDDNFTGLDLSLNPLDLELEFSGAEVAAFGNRIVQSWVGFDILISLSSSGLLIRK